MNEIQYIILHHSNGTEADSSADTSSHTLEIINSWHKQLWPNFISRAGWNCGYHLVIEKNGLVRRAREDDEIGAHCIGMNDKSIGICIIGNFDRLPSLANSKPTKEQEASLKKLLEELSLKYNIPPEKIVPHRFFANKSCYGKNLTDSWGRDLIKEEITPTIEELQKKQLTLLQQIVELLKLLIIRTQNRLMGSKYV